MSFITDISYLAFLLQLLANFLVGGLILTSCFLRLLKQKNLQYNALMLFLAGIGFAPYFTSLLLYYLLWLIPDKHSIFYFGIIILVYFNLAILGKKQIIPCLNEVVREFKQIFGKLVRYVLLLGVLVFVLAWSYYITNKGIVEHDMLEYAVQGKVFFNELAIDYKAHNYDESTAFYYVGLHGYSFPLLASWERIVNDQFGIESDYFFRSLNSIYGILIVLLVALVSMIKVNKKLALWVLFALPLTYGFLETLSKYHIDFYRIFFVNLSLIALYLGLKKGNSLLQFALALSLGAMANIHSLGAMLMALMLLSFFLFSQGSILIRIRNSATVLSLALVFGAIHYIIDIIWGTGWLFQEIKFY